MQVDRIGDGHQDFGGQTVHVVIPGEGEAHRAGERIRVVVVIEAMGVVGLDDGILWQRMAQPQRDAVRVEVKVGAVGGVLAHVISQPGLQLRVRDGEVAGEGQRVAVVVAVKHGGRGEEIVPTPKP